jgi:adenylate kinase
MHLYKVYTVVFIGPQGSGKGTQIEKLKTVLEADDERRRVVDIQTGRRFRSLAAKQETFAEDKVAATLDAGILQPDFLSAVLWGQAMVDQLDLEDAFHFFERGMVDVINLVTPEAVVRARMQSRARADDTTASIEERLRWYREDTMPVVEYYRTRADTAVHDIDGTQDIEGVHAQIVAALKLE